MPSVTFSFAYRPIRLGLVIRQGELDDVIRAATVCTQLWGGMFNVLIPVPDGDEEATQARELVGRYLVDNLVPLAESDALANFVASEQGRVPTLRFGHKEPYLIPTWTGSESSPIRT